MNQLIDFYSIQTTPGSGNFLLPDDRSHSIIEEVKGLMKESSDGKLPYQAIKLYMRSEMEGEVDSYTPEEISQNVESSVPIDYAAYSPICIVSNSFVATIESLGITRFVAHRCLLVHEATNREWEYWFLRYTLPLSSKRKEIKGTESYFLDCDGISVPYYSSAIKDALTALQMPSIKFNKRSLGQYNDSFIWLKG